MTVSRGAAILNSSCRPPAGQTGHARRLRDGSGPDRRAVKGTYDADEDRQFVFTHLVQIVGEAASRVSPEEREPRIPVPTTPTLREWVDRLLSEKRHTLKSSSLERLSQSAERLLNAIGENVWLDDVSASDAAA